MATLDFVGKYRAYLTLPNVPVPIVWQIWKLPMIDLFYIFWETDINILNVDKY